MSGPLGDGDMLATYVNADNWGGFAYAPTTQYGFPLGMNLNYSPNIDITENSFARLVNLVSRLALPRHQPAALPVLPARRGAGLPAAADGQSRWTGRDRARHRLRAHPVPLRPWPGPHLPRHAVQRRHRHAAGLRHRARASLPRLLMRRRRLLARSLRAGLDRAGRPRARDGVERPVLRGLHGDPRRRRRWSGASPSATAGSTSCGGALPVVAVGVLAVVGFVPGAAHGDRAPRPAHRWPSACPSSR